MKGAFALSALLFVLFAFLTGCDSDYNNPLETQKVINVSGRVKGGIFNEGLPYAKIRIEDKVTYTDEFGYFNISQVKTPYTVYITDSVANSGCIYDGLTESECILRFFSRDYLYSKSAQIIYTYTGSATSNTKKLFFTDGKNISGVGGINSSSSCNVFLPDNNPVKGRAYLLLYTLGTSYDRFGFIDNVTLSPNSNINLVFNDSICNIIPGSVRVSGTINISNPQLSNSFALSAIYFSPRMFSSFAQDLMIESIVGNTFNVLIPSNIGVDYFPMIWIMFFNGATGASSKCFYSLPKAGGTGLVLNVPPTPEIVYPNELSSIDDNTLFVSIYPGEHIIYEMKFTDSVKTVMYYMRSNEVRLAKMSKLGLGSFASNAVVTLTVTALGQFDFLDDFVNTSRNNLLQSTSFPVSKRYYYNP